MTTSGRYCLHVEFGGKEGGLDLTPTSGRARTTDWLNEFTPDDIAFYLVKVEAIRIGDHPVAGAAIHGHQRAK